MTDNWEQTPGGLVVPKKDADALATKTAQDTTREFKLQQVSKDGFLFTPTKIPPGWVRATHTNNGTPWSEVSCGRGWRNKKKKLLVVASVKRHEDKKLWIHVSASNPKRVPNYAELDYVKRHWIGNDMYAVQVFPPSTSKINIAVHALHLWACLDGWPLPEFSNRLDGIGI